MRKGIKTALCCGTVLLLVGGACIAKGAAANGTWRMLGWNHDYFSIFPVRSTLDHALHWGDNLSLGIADELDDWFGFNSEIGRWISRRVQREVRDEMRNEMRETLQELEDDWDDDWDDWDDDYYRSARNDLDDIDGRILPRYGQDDIQKIELTVWDGTVTLARGSDFDLTGSFTLTENDIDSHTWEIELSGEEGGTVLTLPEELTLAEIELNVERGGLVVTQPLSATRSIEITVESGTCLLDSIDSAVPELDIEVGTGMLTGVLPYPHGEIKAKVGHTPGAILIDKQTLVGQDAGDVYRTTVPYTDPSVSNNKIRLSVGTGQIDLLTKAE